MGSPYINFLKQIESIEDLDYGDFMRKANLYLNELLENEEIAQNPILLARVEAMQKYIQFQPNWDIESTREQIHVDAENLMFLGSIYAS